MIDAAVRIVDLDPDGFSWLNRCLAARDGGSEVSVLHDGATVVQLAGPTADAVAVGDAVHDPAVLAASVAMATNADRVTVIDRGVLDDVSATLVDLGRSCRSQGELLWRARERWNAHPGVVMVPPPMPSRWPAVVAMLAAVPDDHWLVARVRDDDAAPFVLAARVRDGLVVEVTSAEPNPDDIAALLQTDRATVERVLASADPLAELVAALDEATTDHRGLDALRGFA